jgi:hypothetical protein
VLHVSGGGQNLYPLRKLLETLQGHDVKVELIVKDEKGTLEGKRGEIERLLNDYSVPFKWHEGGENDS